MNNSSFSITSVHRLFFSLTKGYLFILALLVIPHLVSSQSPNHRCGTTDTSLLPQVERYLENIPKHASARTSMGETLVYRLAIDVNYNTYQLYRSDKIQITKIVHEFIEKASEVYEREVNIKLVVSDLLIWDTPEPYPLVEDLDYYNNIVNYWTGQRPGDHDCIVSLSVRNGWFYGGGRMCTSNFPGPDNTTMAVDILCHELGHTLGSPHTHSCYWPGGPIDVCAETEIQSEECFSPYTDNVNGSIMSYCRTLLEFHPYCRELIRAYSEGKVQEVFFSLYGFTPPGSVNLRLETLPQSQGSKIPAFSWRSNFRISKFRFQVASDPGFATMVIDTVLSQPFFRSVQVPGGNQFARVRSESGGQTGNWSNQMPFAMPDFDNHRLPPELINPRIFSNGSLATSFLNEPKADAYRVEVFNQYTGEIYSSTESLTSSGSVQQIAFSSPFSNYQIRLRVRYGSVWSDWSPYPLNLTYDWSNEVSLSSQLINTSANPLLSFQASAGQEHLGLTHYFEASKDENFSTIVSRDSVVSNLLNTYYTNKFHFNPILEENEQYFIRTRTSSKPGNYSEWSRNPLETGREDKRFEYLRTLSKFSVAASNFAERAQSARFMKSGNRLYAYGDYSSGYYVTSDLKTWEERTGRSTQGKIPYFFHAFAATPQGETFMLYPPRSIIQSNPDGTFQYTEMSRDLYLYQTIQGHATRDNGLFFIVPNQGIAQLLNGNLHYFQQETFSSYLALALGSAPNGRLWALIEGGWVYIFENGTWNQHSYFPYWRSGGSFCFDLNGSVFLYGDFGVAALNGLNWENIAAVKGYPIRKAVFDKENQLWMASYRSSGPQSFENYALMKLKNGNLTSYTDGLNFLRDQFDIEHFNDKLVIMTSGGEIHTFDESHIQRFIPSAQYCHGEEIEVTITSNSSFGRGNNLTIELINTESGESRILGSTIEGNDILRAVFPESVPEGIYKIRTSSTSPAIVSNESDVFRIYPLSKPEVKKEMVGNFKYRLSTIPEVGSTYQWLLNNTPIPDEIATVVDVTSSGTYSLQATNKGGCTVVSEPVTILISEPEELTLLQNVPNPFSGNTDIAFYLPSSQHTKLEVFDIIGRKIAILKDQILPQGWHEVLLTGRGFSPGVYVYVLDTKDGKRSLKAVKN